MTDRDWLQLIDKRAAVREQFPPMSRVRHERPGCAADIARQAFYRAENRLSVIAAEEARWARSVAENTARKDRVEARAANAEYNAQKRRKQDAA